MPPPPPGMTAPQGPPADPVTAFLAAAVERHGAMQLHPDDIARLGRRIVTIEASSIVPGALSLDVVPDDTYAEAMHYARQLQAAARSPHGAGQVPGFLAELGMRFVRLNDVERAAVMRVVGDVLPPRREALRIDAAPGTAAPDPATTPDPGLDAPEDAPDRGNTGNVVVFDATRTPTAPRVRAPRGFTPEGL